LIKSYAMIPNCERFNDDTELYLYLQNSISKKYYISISEKFTSELY